MWIICGIISVVLCIVSWVLIAKKSTKAGWAAICSLAFVSLTLLAQYKLISDWVGKEDWSALMDVVPSMFWLLMGYVIVMIGANVIPLIVGRKHNN